MTASKHLPAGIALFTLLAFVWLVYGPGLTGPFLFDDYPTLKVIANVGGVHSTDQFLRFVTTGEASALGRPVALLSFLIDTQDWPTDAGSFLRTNLLIHLLNGTLVCWFTLLLARLLRVGECRSQGMALLVCAVWLLHPINIATVLFVVQRMTELMALFTLVGLIAWLRGRDRLARGERCGYLWMSAGIVAGGALATLSKENGVLLLLYVLVLEYWLLQPVGLAVPAHFRSWAVAFLYAPLLALAGYIALHWQGHTATYLNRDFTPGERLLSEARALIDYLRLIIAPSVTRMNVFTDDFTVSRSLFDPGTTLPGVLAVIALLALGIVAKRRAPMLAMGIGWFFAGHALESTVIPLELYFLHRNYLPMLGPLLAGVHYLLEATRRSPKAAYVIVPVYLGLLSMVTYQVTTLWGNPNIRALVYAGEHPTSLRAQQFAARYWTAIGQYAMARRNYQTALEHHPGNPAIALQLIQNACLAGQLRQGDLGRAQESLKTGPLDNAAVDTLYDLFSFARENSCPNLTTSELHGAIAALLGNPHYHGNSRTQLYYLDAQIYHLERNLNAAIINLERSWARNNHNVDVMLNAAYWLITAELYEQALDKLALAHEADEHNTRWLRGQRRADIDSLERYARQMIGKRVRATSTQ